MRLFCVLCAFILSVSVAVAAEPVAGEEFLSYLEDSDKNSYAIKATDQLGKYFWYMNVDSISSKSLAVVEGECLHVQGESSLCLVAGDIVSKQSDGTKNIYLPGQVGYIFYKRIMKNYEAAKYFSDRQP